MTTYCTTIATGVLCLWNIHIMMTSSNGNIFRVTGPLCGEFTGPGDFPAQRPVTRSLDVFFDLRPNKRLSKQPWGWWFETPSWSLWRQRNVDIHHGETHRWNTFSWQACLSVAFTQLFEMFDSKRRALVGMGREYLWVLGVFYVAGMGYFVRNWRLLQLILSLTAALGLINVV